MLAALVFVRNNREAAASSGIESGLLAVLRRLRLRKEEFGNPTIIKNVDEFAEAFGLSKEETSHEVEATVSVAESDDFPSTPRLNPLDEWQVERASLDPIARAQGDARFLSAYGDRLIPTNFAEALYDDDDIWQEPAIELWLDDRGEPLDATRAGVASAALLNARIRVVRPRFFLRNPTSLVVQPIANSAEVEQLRNEVRSDFVVRALSTVFDARAVLETERRRGAKATVRKGELLKVSDTLKALFARLGYDERPAVGTAVNFDPVAHQGPIDVQTQESVIVRRPGLWDLTDQRFVIKPVVDRTPEELGEEQVSGINPIEVGEGDE